MSETVAFAVAEALPLREDVLANQSIPVAPALPPAIEELYAAACNLFAKSAQPAGALAEISRDEFEAVYRGEGQNEPAAPVSGILDRAESLALYAATVGQRVSDQIEDCFRANDFALAAMLDSVASAAADKLGELVESRFLQVLSERKLTTSDTRAMRYSPGYCGWHISGQRRLFDFLRPGRIGITLRDSFLMEPLKSVSGVIMVGPTGIHAIQDSYPFCEKCRTHGCRERTDSLAHQ
jgi:hypothetical protein